MTIPATDTIIMFSTPWCGYCQRLKAQMTREGIAYTEINIEVDPESAALSPIRRSLRSRRRQAPDRLLTLGV